MSKARGILKDILEYYQGLNWNEDIEVELSEIILAYARIKELEEQNKWISVKDKNRRPEIAKKTLIYTKDGNTTTCIYINRGSNWGYNEGGHIRLTDVIYWKPLPEPPEDK